MEFVSSSPRPRSPRNYSKDLNVHVQLRLTSQDVDFLRWLADGYGFSLSGAIRLVIRSYRSTLDKQDDIMAVLAPDLPPSIVPPIPSDDLSFISQEDLVTPFK